MDTEAGEKGREYFPTAREGRGGQGAAGKFHCRRWRGKKLELRMIKYSLKWLSSQSLEKPPDDL